jgi:uncharacterized membrane protein YbhN (UPF0104 family)
VETTPARPSRARTSLRLAVGLALVAAVLWGLAPRWSELLALVDPDPAAVALALLATTVASAAASGRWKLLAEGMGGTPLRWAVYFHAFSLTRVLGQFTSNLAMDTLGRGVALRSAGSERGLSHALAPIVIERIFDLLLPLVVGAWALAVLRFGLAAHAEALLVGAAVAFGAAAVPLLRPLAALALRTWVWLARRPVEDRALLAIAPRLAAAVAALSLLRFAAVVLQFWAIAAGLGLDVDWRSMTAATPVAQIASLVGFTPGSLGFQEAGWAVGLRLVAVPPAAIALFVLGQRVAVTSFFALLAALAWPAARADRLRAGSNSDRTAGT